jgi:hypothetical protein
MKRSKVQSKWGEEYDNEDVDDSLELKPIQL